MKKAKKPKKPREPMTGTERYERWNRKLARTGGRRITAHIGPEATKSLHKMMLAAPNDSMSAVLDRALIILGGLKPVLAAAKRAELPRPSNYGKGATAY